MATSYENFVSEINTAGSSRLVDASLRLSDVPDDAANMRIRRLIHLLGSSRLSERILSARELGDMAFVEGYKISEAVSPLISILKNDAESSARQEAAWALWKLGDMRACKALLTALVEDRSIKVRERAARALGLLGAKEAVPKLLDLIGLGKLIPAKLRAGLVAAVGLLAGQDELSVIYGMTKDAEPKVRAEAVRALGRFLVDSTREISAGVLKKLKIFLKPYRESRPVVRMAAVKALSLLSSENAQKLIARTLVKDPDPDVRRLAAETIYLWDLPSSEETLIKALEDDSWDVRKTVSKTICQCVKRGSVYRPAKVTEVLSRVIAMFPSTSSERCAAKEALIALHNRGQTPENRCQSPRSLSEYSPAANFVGIRPASSTPTGS